MADVRLTDDDLRQLSACGGKQAHVGAMARELLAARAREARVRAVPAQFVIVDITSWRRVYAADAIDAALAEKEPKP
jgi:hypothetical protein